MPLPSPFRRSRSARPAPRPARGRQLTGPELLESRVVPAVTPVTVSVTNYFQTDNPESPDLDDGDYYVTIFIDGQKYSTIDHEHTGSDFNPTAPGFDHPWTFTQNVDLSKGTIAVGIAVLDDDDFLRAPDDLIDVSPTAGVQTLSLQLDLQTGKWTGDAVWPNNVATGNGDGLARGRVTFSISVPVAGPDTDGDGLPDVWETQGVDSNGDGTPDLLLPGADPNHKDLYVEVDAMAGRGPSPLPPITATTGAGVPVVVTAAGHGLTTGTRVTVAGVAGNTAANGTFTVTRLDADRFRLDGSSGNGAYGGGGTWSLADLAGTGLATGTTLDLVIDAFRKAPVSNPAGGPGINLHILLDDTAAPLVGWDTDKDGDGKSPYGEDKNANGTLDAGEDTDGDTKLGDGDPDDQSAAPFQIAFKQTWLGTAAERALAEPQRTAALEARRLATRYAVFADYWVNGAGAGEGVEIDRSGLAWSESDFVVTLGKWGTPGGTGEDQAGTFMHELGHTLGLAHGGGDGMNFKPNYFSVMNYTWQTSDAGFPESWRLDYSSGTANQLNENAGLDETVGIGGRNGLRVRIGPPVVPPGSPPGTAASSRVVNQTGRVDWSNGNADGAGAADDDTGVSADVNRMGDDDPATPGELLKDFDDWTNLKYRIGLPGLTDTGINPDTEEQNFRDRLEREGTIFYATPSGNGADSLTLRRNGGLIELYDNNAGRVVASGPAATTHFVRVVGAEGEADSLTVDFAGGNPVPDGGVTFAGGGGAGVDTLALAGTPPGTPSYTPGDDGKPGGGRLDLGGSFVTFTGLEYVRPVAPRVTKVQTSAAAVNENDTATVSGEFLDPGTLSSHSVTVVWGDGETDGPFALPAGARSFSLTHRYRDDNPTGTPSDLNAVVVTITDDDALGGTGNTSITVNNLDPTLSNVAVTPAVDEDGVVTLTGDIADTGTLDSFRVAVDWGEGAPEVFTYPAGTTHFSETHRYRDDDPTGTPQDVYAIRVTLRDDDTGGPPAVGVSTPVRNVAPVITGYATSSPSTDPGREGEPTSVSGTFTDVGTRDTHTATIDWDDGSVTPATVTEAGGSGSFTASHTYTSGGIYTVRVVLRDDDTGEATAIRTLFITGVGVHRLPDGRTALEVIGSAAGDDVTITREGAGLYRVNASFLPENTRAVPAAGIDVLEVVMLGGNDRVTVAGGVDLVAVIDGGDGDDRLNGGNAGSVLIGGRGDDVLLGGLGRNLLIGGVGADWLNGNSDDDILIGGYTAYDSGADDDKLANDLRLLALFEEWNSARPRHERLANLALGTGPVLGGTGLSLRKGVTVFDDTDADDLTGGAGTEWYFFDDRDRLHGDQAGETRN